MSKCNCIKNVEERVKKHIIEQKQFKKPVEAVSLQGVAWTFSDEVKTFNELEIKLEGQKKKPSINIFHSYCPFCGIKVGD